jgi:hemoglobin-like flavoprotein
MAPIVSSMTATQHALVRQSFELLRENSRPFMLLFYGKLFEMDPSARSLFHNDISLQGRKLMDMLAEVVNSLDNFQPLRPRLAELGRKHASYGVRSEQYETLTSALLWAIAQELEGNFNAAMKEAWRLAITRVCEAMRAGVE